MTNFISVTNTNQDRLNINIDHIVLYHESSPNVIGESVIVTTGKEYHVMETNNRIYELLTAARG